MNEVKAIDKIIVMFVESDWDTIKLNFAVHDVGGHIIERRTYNNEGNHKIRGGCQSAKLGKCRELDKSRQKYEINMLFNS